MPDTTVPYRVAYVVVALVFVTYALSIWWRAKNVREKIASRRPADPSLRSG